MLNLQDVYDSNKNNVVLCVIEAIRNGDQVVLDKLSDQADVFNALLDFLDCQNIGHLGRLINAIGTGSGVDSTPSG